MSDLSLLASSPPDVAEALSLIDGLDTCLHVGFSRMTPEQSDALTALGRVFAGTPLSERLEKAAEGLKSAAFLPEHILVLALARASLFGAVHDALANQAAKALDRSLVASGAPVMPGPPQGAAATWLNGTREMMGKLAITGFSWLDDTLVATLEPTLERLQEEPSLFRLAALITGLHRELSDAMPIQADSVPIRRWADLWTQALLLCRGMPPAPDLTQVSGKFEPLGAELRQHAHTVSLLVHGVLTVGAERKLVRTTISSWRVEVLSGPDYWRVLQSREGHNLPANDALVEAVRTSKALEIKGMKLSASGELLWVGEAKVGAAVDPFAVEIPSELPRAMAHERHPVQLAVPVVLNGPATEEGMLEGLKVTLSLDPAMPIKLDTLKTASRVLGILRWNNGWYLQPLSVESKAGKKSAVVYTGQYGAAVKLKEDRFLMLQYKASKLLRKKS